MPREIDWQTLQRVARYLLQFPISVHTFEWQLTGHIIVTHADSDWAGAKQDRTSTSGGALSLGAHTLKTRSSTQHCIAMSSGEAELYALVRGAAQTKGLMSLMAEYGTSTTGTVCTDAVVAIGMAHRQGLGHNSTH